MVPSFPNTFIHQLKKENKNKNKNKENHSHAPIPDLARAFHMVKVLTVKSAKKQQHPDVFSLNLKADILYIAFIPDPALLFCTYWQVTLRWRQPCGASPRPQQPVGEVAEDSQLSCPQPVPLLCPLRTEGVWGQRGVCAVGGAVAAEYVQVCVITDNYCCFSPAVCRHRRLSGPGGSCCSSPCRWSRSVSPSRLQGYFWSGDSPSRTRKEEAVLSHHTRRAGRHSWHPLGLLCTFKKINKNYDALYNVQLSFNGSSHLSIAHILLIKL